MYTKDGFHKALEQKLGDDAYLLLANGGHKKLTDLLTAASLTADGNNTKLSVTVGGTTKTGSVTVPYASAAAKWSTARTLTIGSTGKSVNGSANVSWSLDEIGVYSKTASDSRYLQLSGGTMTGNISFSNSGTGFRGINYGTMGDNDQWRIGGAATGSNAGYMELATADDGNEPIYVRQYTGVFSTLTRTATLLDASGNTSFPGVVTASRFVSSVGTGTQPYACSSTTVNTNLNADLLDGIHVNGLLTAASLGTSGNSTTISVTVGGTTKTGSVTVPYASNADKVDGIHANGLLTAASLGTSGNSTTISVTVGGTTKTGSVIVPYSNTAYQLSNIASVDGGNTSKYLWRRIAFSGERTSNWNDCDALILIKHNYNGGRFGLLKISFRTDNIVDGANASASAIWLARSGFTSDSVKVALYKVKGKAYADIYLNVGTYPRCTIHTLKTSGWTFYSSNESDNSANPVNAYTSIESGATTIHRVAYTSITNSSDGATVSYANSAGSVAWGNVTSKPATATRWPTWDEVTGKPLSATSGNNGPTWGNFVPVKSDGVMEIGKYLDFHNSSNDGVDYAVRLQCQGNNKVVINLPTGAGTLARTADLTWGNVSSKPATATRWPTWAEVTSKPSSTGSGTQPVYWNGSTFVACTTYANASVKYATSAGNADTVDSLHASDFVRAYGTTNDNIDSDWGQSFKTFDPIPSGNPPAQNPNISTINIGNNFIRRKQLAFLYNVDDIYYRRRTDGGWNSWVKLIHSGNIGSQSVSYASSAGNADTVDSQHFKWSNDSNSPTYLWAANSSGTAFLCARGSMSVNYASSADYATSAGSATTASQVKDAGNNTAITFKYSSGGFTSNPSWLGAWNGYQLTYVSPSVLSVNYASSAGSVAWGNVTGKPSSFTPASHTHNYIKMSSASENDCIPSEYSSFQPFICSSSTTGYGDGYITAWRWAGGGYVTQLYTEVDPSFAMYYRYRDNSGNWGSWQRIYGDGYHPSADNASLLGGYGQSDFVHKTGDTMTGLLYINRSATNAPSIKWNKAGTYWGGIGYGGTSDENVFGPVDSNGNWVTSTSPDTWTFRGNVKGYNFYTSSDRTKKTNIESIASIVPIRKFNWKQDGSLSYGFIAQELVELGHEELVHGTEGNMTVNYDAALSLSMAKLSNYVERLENTVKELQQEIKILKGEA